MPCSLRRNGSFASQYGAVANLVEENYSPIFA